MRSKTPTPVTVIKGATDPTVAAKSSPPENFKKKMKPEPIRRATPLSASAKKQMLNEKLLTAAWNGDTEEAWELIDKGADVHARNSFGETALHLAAHGGHSLTVELLLAKKADINAVDKEGNTALLLACCFKQIDVILILIKNGADVGIKNKNGVTALRYLHWFVKNNKDILNVMERGAHIDHRIIKFSAKKPKENDKNNSRNGSLDQ